ncbi:MAG: hypothetical protein AAF609_16910 [Cyanobacteria bacterium P01_C01_bin.120]
MAIDRAGECPLCGRWLQLTFHHLIPKKLHRRTRFKKNYSKTELNQGVWVCRLCHDGIHDHYDEMALAKHFPTLESIQTDPNIRRHAEWVAKQKVKR